MTTLPIRNSINRSPLWLGFLFIPLVLACFGLSPIVQAADGDLGKGNTSEGANALQSLTTGIHDTALGYQTLFLDTVGNYNTATGSQALKNNTADNNTANGFQALFFNTTGANNAATGWRALFSNTAGDANTANGLQALNSNTIGNGNTAMGFQALFNNTTGSHNAAVGEDALSGNTTGSFNIALGYGCGGDVTTGSFNIDIGNRGVAGDDSTIRIGTSHSATFIAGISGAAVTGAAVVVNSSGQLGVTPSSARFKAEIKPMDKASEAILALKPVTFRYKHEVDPKGVLQFGLVAEEVEKVNPALVARDAQGKLYTVRYEAVNAMLLNEFLKEHRKVEQLKKDFESRLAEQQKQIKALTSGLEKVNNQLELNKPAPQMVSSNQ
jgi:Chaperone of endosialidase